MTPGNLSRAAWLELPRGEAPPTQPGAVMADDPADRGVLLLTGGGQTWLFAGGGWTNLVVSGPPNATTRAMAYDPLDGYVLLTGDFLSKSTSVALPATWIFANDSWTNATHGAQPRSTPGWTPQLVFDSSHDAMLLYTESLPGPFTWTYRGGNWTPFPYAALPAGTIYGNPVIADDPPDLGVMACIDSSSASNNLTACYLFNGTDWLPLPTAHMGPPGACLMVFDPALGADIAFGGQGSKYGIDSNGTWAHRNDSWILLAPPVSPSGRLPEAYSFDSTAGEVLLYSGMPPTAPSPNDTWLFGTGFVQVGGSPATGGSVAIDGSTALSPSLELGLGVHSVTATAGSGEHFGRWLSTDAVGVADPLLLATNLTVAGNGSLTASFSGNPIIGVRVVPARCGPIQIGGVPFFDGTPFRPAPTSNPFQLTVATVCGPIRFGEWRVTGNLTLDGNDSSDRDLLVVAGNGTLEAVFAAPVLVEVQPVALGWIALDGTSYANGTTAWLLLGPHGASPVAQLWASAEPMQVTSGDISYSNGTLEVHGPGTLADIFTPLPIVRTESSPAACGPVWVNGTPYANGSLVPVPDLTAVPLTAPICALLGPGGSVDFVFRHWASTSALLVGEADAWNTTLVGEGNGTLVAVYGQQSSVTWSISPRNAGEIELNGSPIRSDGTASVLWNGGYSVAWLPSAPYAATGTWASAWVVTGDVSVSGENLSIRGPGTVHLYIRAAAGPVPLDMRVAPWPIWAVIGALGIVAAVAAAFLLTPSRRQPRARRGDSK